MILQAHPMGNAFVRYLGEALARSGLLSEYLTGIHYPQDDRWLAWLPARIRTELRRRRVPPVLEPFTRGRALHEGMRVLAHRLRWQGLVAHERGRFSVDAVFHDFDRYVARRLRRNRALRGIYLYEDGAEWSFAAARERGVHCFYDLPIGYWREARTLLTEESDLSPEWAGTMHGNRDSPAKTDRKDRELALAQTIFVASTFTKKTLAAAPQLGGEVIVAPYGAPPTPAGFTPARRKPGEPLRVLFVGSLGQRKGTRYLLEAVAAAGPGVQLTLIGAAPAVTCVPLSRALPRHRHVTSLPHSGILAEMAQHHVLVFPSLFEGFGLVILEAMSRGLPVIATAHTAGPDVLREGVDGFIVPIRDPQAIAARLTLLAEDEPRRQQMAAAAIARAAEFTWEAYGATIVNALRARLPAA